MKKIGKFLILVFAVSLFAVTNSDAQYVNVLPAAPKNLKKTASASKYQVWVPEDWIFVQNQGYVYRAGYWDFPPTPKSVYVPGRWEKTPKGYSRRPGYWSTPR